MSIKYHVYYLLDNQSKVERGRKTQQHDHILCLLGSPRCWSLILYMAQLLLGFQIYYVPSTKNKYCHLVTNRFQMAKFYIHVCTNLNKEKKRNEKNIIQPILTHHVHNLCFMEIFDFMRNVLNGTISIKII